MTTYTYGPWTIVIKMDDHEQDRPWTWHASGDGAMLLEDEAIYSLEAAQREAEAACGDYHDDG